MHCSKLIIFSFLLAMYSHTSWADETTFVDEAPSCLSLEEPISDNSKSSVSLTTQELSHLVTSYSFAISNGNVEEAFHALRSGLIQNRVSITRRFIFLKPYSPQCLGWGVIEKFNYLQIAATMDVEPIVQYLKARGGDINEKLSYFKEFPKQGLTALEVEVIADNEAQVRNLLKHGADPTIGNPIKFAAHNCNISMIKLLLAHGATVSKNNIPWVGRYKNYAYKFFVKREIIKPIKFRVFKVWECQNLLRSAAK